MSGWEAIAAQWDTMQGQYGDVYRRALIHPHLVDVLPPLGGKRVLDLGSGNGSFARYLSDGGATVCGAEISSSLIELARARSSVSSIEYIEADLTHPRAYGEFDIVTCLFSHQDIGSIEHIFSSAALNLKRGGELAIVFEDLTAVESTRSHHSSRREWVSEADETAEFRDQRIWWQLEGVTEPVSVVTRLWRLVAYRRQAVASGFVEKGPAVLLSHADGIPFSYTEHPRFYCQVFTWTARVLDEPATP